MAESLLTNGTSIATYSGAPAARADSTKPDAAYYIDAQGVVVRADGYAGYRDLVKHTRKNPMPTGLVWLLGVIMGWGVLAAAAGLVYVILKWVWS